MASWVRPSWRALVGDTRGGIPGPVDIRAGCVDRDSDARRRGHDGARLLALGLAQRLPEERTEVGACIGIGQGHQRRQVVDAFGEILSGRLEELARGGRDVEDVVADLEHHAEAVAVLGQCVDLGRRDGPR